MNRQELDSILEAFLDGRAGLIDVRELDEWEDGHVAGAQHSPLSALEDLGCTTSFESKECWYTYCRAGRRAVVALGHFKSIGSPTIALPFGFEELAQAGFPIET